MTAAVPGFLFIDHVAIAVPAGAMDAQVRAYEQLGFQVVHEEDVRGSDQVREVMLRMGTGENLVQLLEPLAPESPVAKVLERNGGRAGFAHIAYRVTDIGHAFEQMKAAGVAILDAAPRPGSRGTKIFFVHPKAFGYLMEIVEARSDTMVE